MIRMTFFSFVGHVAAFLVLVFLSWYQPIPKLKRPNLRKVRINVIQRTPQPAAPKKTPRAVPVTPKPRTPKPRKTIVKPKKKTPTPKKKTPKKRKKTPTPKRRKKTPRPRRTPRPTPRRTPRPRPTPRRTPKLTPRPAVVTPRPGRSVAFQSSPLSDYEYYKLAALYKIESNFKLPRHLRVKGLTCLMRITILRDGRIANIQLVKSTGDPILDGYARRALEMTARLAPLPDTLRADHVVLPILFSYEPPPE